MWGCFIRETLRKILHLGSKPNITLNMVIRDSVGMRMFFADLGFSRGL